MGEKIRRKNNLTREKNPFTCIGRGSARNVLLLCIAYLNNLKCLFLTKLIVFFIKKKLIVKG